MTCNIADMLRTNRAGEGRCTAKLGPTHTELLQAVACDVGPSVMTPLVPFQLLRPSAVGIGMRIVPASLDVHLDVMRWK